MAATCRYTADYRQRAVNLPATASHLLGASVQLAGTAGQHVGGGGQFVGINGQHFGAVSQPAAGRGQTGWQRLFSLHGAERSEVWRSALRSPHSIIPVDPTRDSHRDSDDGSVPLRR